MVMTSQRRYPLSVTYVLVLFRYLRHPTRVVGRRPNLKGRCDIRENSKVLANVVSSAERGSHKATLPLQESRVPSIITAIYASH